MFKPFHDRSLIDKVSDIKPNRVAENGQNKSNEKSNYEIEIKKMRFAQTFSGRPWCQPYSCPADSCRPIRADRFMPDRFVP